MDFEKEKTEKALSIMKTDKEAFKRIIRELTALPDIKMTEEEQEKVISVIKSCFEV